MFLHLCFSGAETEAAVCFSKFPTLLIGLSYLTNHKDYGTRSSQQYVSPNFF